MDEDNLHDVDMDDVEYKDAMKPSIKLTLDDDRVISTNELGMSEDEVAHVVTEESKEDDPNESISTTLAREASVMKVPFKSDRYNKQNNQRLSLDEQIRSAFLNGNDASQRSIRRKPEINSHVPLQKSSSTFSGDSSPLENDAYAMETNESELFVTQASHEETTTNEEPKEIITGYPEETTQPTRRRFIYVTKRPRKSRN
ncbi:unnamed protein product [Anisakis simplex]|uniref:Shugoshin_C domain-containing protein n=1 Tax=Anisakis simplex TaxID=6269 RepID=A0A0M3KG87_ANISI|nr:unnamed protein product [Anisakis simplex]